MTVGIRASVATCGNKLEDTMAGSHVEEVADLKFVEGTLILLPLREGERRTSLGTLL